MITFKEIRARQQKPYKLEEPYYTVTKSYGRYTSIEKTYYDIHGGSFEENVIAFIENMPDALQGYIHTLLSRLPEHQQTMEYKMKCIDYTFYLAFGEFAP